MTESFSFSVDWAYLLQLCYQYGVWAVCLFIGFILFLAYHHAKYGKPDNLIKVFVYSFMTFLVIPPWTTILGYGFAEYYANRKVCYRLNQTLPELLPQCLQPTDVLIYNQPRQHIDTSTSFWYLRGNTLSQADVSLYRDGADYKVQVTLNVKEEGVFDQVWRLDAPLSDLKELSFVVRSHTGLQGTLVPATRHQHNHCQLYRLKGTDHYVAYFEAEGATYVGVLQGDNPRWVFAPYYVDPALVELDGV